MPPSSSAPLPPPHPASHWVGSNCCPWPPPRHPALRTAGSWIQLMAWVVGLGCLVWVVWCFGYLGSPNIITTSWLEEDYLNKFTLPRKIKLTVLNLIFSPLWKGNHLPKLRSRGSMLVFVAVLGLEVFLIQLFEVSVLRVFATVIRSTDSLAPWCKEYLYSLKIQLQYSHLNLYIYIYTCTYIYMHKQISHRFIIHVMNHYMTIPGSFWRPSVIDDVNLLVLQQFLRTHGGGGLATSFILNW